MIQKVLEDEYIVVHIAKTKSEKDSSFEKRLLNNNLDVDYQGNKERLIVQEIRDMVFNYILNKNTEKEG